MECAIIIYLLNKSYFFFFGVYFFFLIRDLKNITHLFDHRTKKLGQTNRIQIEDFDTVNKRVVFQIKQI